MKWGREIKIGLLFIVVLAVLFWGYKFLKGQNVFNDSNTYKISYGFVDQLAASAPVMVRGMKVGMVSKLYLNPENADEIIVEIEVDGVIKLPQDTKAILYSVGLVGGKAMILEFDKICKEGCIKSGEFIDGEVRGLLGSMVPVSDIDLYLDKIQSGLGGMLDSVGMVSGETGSNASTQVLDMVGNLSSITAKLDLLISRSEANIQNSLSDIQSFTSNLKDNEAYLTNVMKNLDVISGQLAGAQLDNTMVKIDSTIDKLSVSINGLKSVVKSADNSFDNIDSMIGQIEQGQGSLGKLIAKDDLYNDLNKTIEQLNFLLQDLRLNPQRYVKVSVFGKKDEDYQKPENDPAISN